MHGSVVLFVLLSCLSVVSSMTRVYDFLVEETPVTRLGKSKNIITVNGMFPGPTIYANDGDRLLIKVVNTVKQKISIHWHGIRQLRTPWADGPAYVTQCPIKQNQQYLYNFTVDGQKGTLFWHAHIMWLRATTYGAIVIYPKSTSSYPFKSPYEEHMIMLGEWWNDEVQSIEDNVLATGGGPKESDAYTINGFPGPLYDDAEDSDVYSLHAVKGKTYLLRIINAALNVELFFSIAGHSLTVVEADAEYTKPYRTNTIMVAPGQTTNVLFTADQRCGKYFMYASPYMSAQNVPFTSTPGAAVLEYIGCNSGNNPIQPVVPLHNDTVYATQFTTSIKSLASPQFSVSKNAGSSEGVPLSVDQEFLMTIGLALKDCNPGVKCTGPFGGNFSATINNVSFVLPKISILQAYYYNISGVYGTEFPKAPINPFNYTGELPGNLRPKEGTLLNVIPYGSNVQIIFQNTGILGFENHPIHLHGYNFYSIGHGFGNYDAKASKFNLVDPPLRNTVAVPSGGWAAVRFNADNPGIWYMHCHLEIHTTWGLATGFIVLNGDGPEQSLLPPPRDLPKC